MKYLILVIIYICGAAHADQDYICKIEKIIDSDGNPADPFKDIGKEFTMERKTGLMAGTLKNSYITKPQVIDFGSKENSYKVITTTKIEQGVGRGSNIYALNINEYSEKAEKPFIFLQNETVYIGKCKHF